MRLAAGGGLAETLVGRGVAAARERPERDAEVLGEPPEATADALAPRGELGAWHDRHLVVQPIDGRDEVVLEAEGAQEADGLVDVGRGLEFPQERHEQIRAVVRQGISRHLAHGREVDRQTELKEVARGRRPLERETPTFVSAEVLGSEACSARRLPEHRLDATFGSADPALARAGRVGQEDLVRDAVREAAGPQLDLALDSRRQRLCQVEVPRPELLQVSLGRARERSGQGTEKLPAAFSRKPHDFLFLIWWLSHWQRIAVKLLPRWG